MGLALYYLELLVRTVIRKFISSYSVFAERQLLYLPRQINSKREIIGKIKLLLVNGLDVAKKVRMVYRGHKVVVNEMFEIL